MVINELDGIIIGLSQESTVCNDYELATRVARPETG